MSKVYEDNYHKVKSGHLNEHLQKVQPAGYMHNPSKL